MQEPEPHKQAAYRVEWVLDLVFVAQQVVNYNDEDHYGQQQVEPVPDRAHVVYAFAEEDLAFRDQEVAREYEQHCANDVLEDVLGFRRLVFEFLHEEHVRVDEERELVEQKGNEQAVYCRLKGQLPFKIEDGLDTHLLENWLIARPGQGVHKLVAYVRPITMELWQI